MFCSAQVLGVHAFEPHLPPLQLCPLGQVPQSMTPVQPLLAKPHTCPDGQAVAGVQTTLPHSLGTGGCPTPQDSPDGQVPQATSPPQPFGA